MESNFEELPEKTRNELFVDSRGNIFANSLNSVARLCNCSSSSIHEIVNKLALGYCPSPSFQYFVGINLKASKEYSASFILACLEHFSYYAQKTNKIALKNYKILSAFVIDESSLNKSFLDQWFRRLHTKREIQ